MKNFLILPVLLCLILLFWRQHCQAKSQRLVARRMDWIAVPEGLELLEGRGEEEEEEGNDRRRKRPSHQQQMKKRRTNVRSRIQREDEEEHDDGKEEVPFRLDFSALIEEEMRSFENSMPNDEDDEEEGRNDEEKQGEPVAWFTDWERMVQQRENAGRSKVGMRKLKPATKKHPSVSPVANHRHSSSSSPSPSNPAPAAVHPNPRSNLRGPCLRQRKQPSQHRTYPRSYEFPGFEASIPREWDWRNVDGINYCSPNRNQHIPVYCGGCWVFGTLGALNDRFNVARKNRWPMTNLSPQEIIACNGRGSCNGGTAEDVFEHAKTVGLVEEGCNNFKAVNEKCTPFTRCGSCWPDNCFAIQNYTRYYIKDFGKLSGRLNMMSEIHNRGPIACQMGCTQTFDLNYTSGIFSEFGEFPPNHIVSVSGWGWDEDTKTEYWIVRNSWGDAWGEDGWFRVVTSLFKGQRGDQYNMGIERECYFADPDISNLDKR